jgi:hypothetical protein
VIGTVELLPRVRILQPEVRPTVDHHRLGVQFSRDGRRGSVRQGQEHHVVPGQSCRAGLDHDPVGQRGQVRLVLTQGGAGTGAGRQRADLYAGMAAQQAEQLATGISGRSGDRYLEHHLHDYAT